MENYQNAKHKGDVHWDVRNDGGGVLIVAWLWAAARGMAADRPERHLLVCVELHLRNEAVAQTVHEIGRRRPQPICELINPFRQKGYRHDAARSNLRQSRRNHDLKDRLSATASPWPGKLARRLPF
jgi:hypothetical protein